MKKLYLISGFILVLVAMAAASDLSTYKSTYEKNLETIVMSHGSNLNDLGADYTKALNGLLATVKKAGDLDKTTAVMSEIERFKKEKSVPAQSNAFAELKNLQASYIRQERHHEATKSKQVLLLAGKYDDALDRLQRSLVSASKLDDAKQVKEERERVEASGPVVAARATVSGAPKPAVSKPAAPKPPKPVFKPTIGVAKAELTEETILGDWVYKSSKGGFISKMVFKKVDENVYDLVRIGGGPLAVSGKYTLKEGKLQGKLGSWIYKNDKLVLDASKWKDWTLSRP